MNGADKRQTILAALSVLLLAGFGGVRYSMLWQQRQAMDDSVEQSRQTLAEIHRQSARLPELEKQLTQKRLQAEAFDRRIPAGRSFAELWRQIADVMNAHRLIDQTVQPAAAIEDTQLGVIPLTLSCSGAMQDMYAFFKAMEQQDRLIRFEQVELSNDGNFSGVVKLTAKAQLYYQPDKKG